MRNIYGILPQLRDEIELARLCCLFVFGKEEFGDGSADHYFYKLSDLLAERDFERVSETDFGSFDSIQDMDLDGELEQCYMSLYSTFDQICDLVNKYYPNATQNQIYKGVLANTDIWQDLHHLTYQLMIDCLDGETNPDIERHLLYNQDGNKLMTMIVNLIPVVESSTGDNVIAAEHIYIAKCTSALIMQMSRTGIKSHTHISNSVSYKLHNYALKKFKPSYMFSNPLKSIDAVINQLETDNKLAKVWTKRVNAPKDMPFRLKYKDGHSLAVGTCENPSVIYRVIKRENRPQRTLRSSPSSIYSRRIR